MMKQTDLTVEVEGLTKVFRDFWMRPRIVAVDGISFKIARGEVFGLLGPNGSGKSTTLKMLLGLLYPTGGRISILGRPPQDGYARAITGYMPEESYLYKYLTARETLMFYASLFNTTAAQRTERVEQLLEMMGLQHSADRRVGEFSKGMTRKVALAQALINDPELLILDEPTSGLDPVACRQVKDLVITLAKRGKTIILASHLLADVEDICSKIAILYDGRVHVEGTVSEMLQDHKHLSITLDSVEPAVLESVLADIKRHTGRRPEVRHPAYTLEDFFVDVVARARNTEATLPAGGQHGTIASFLSHGTEDRASGSQGRRQ